MRGNKPQIPDDELIRLLEEHGTVTALADVTLYDIDWLRRRLRKAGVPPGKPGRPRKEAG